MMLFSTFGSWRVQQNNTGTKIGISVGVGILIGCGISVLLCLVVGGITAFVVGNSAVKVFGTAASALTNGPYGISQRRLPSEPAASSLLPETVGDFTRGDITTNDNTFQAVYTSPSGTIKATAVVFDSLTLAQNAVRAAHTADPSLDVQITGTDPSYVTNSILPDQATKIFYSRGKYEFGFIGSSASVFNSFITQFPF